MENDSFRDIFMAMPLQCLVLKPEGPSFIIFDANEAFLNTSRKNRTDIIGKSVFQVFRDNPSLDNDWMNQLEESLIKVMRTGEKDEISPLRYDLPLSENQDNFQEKYWTVENFPVLDESGLVDLIMNIGYDITEEVLSSEREKKIQEELLLHQQRTKHFIEGNPDGIYSMDLEGNFTNANEGLATLLGVPINELLNKSLLPFCAPYGQDKVKSCLQVVTRGEANSLEAEFISASGKEIVLEISLIPMMSEEKVVGVYGIAKDLTDTRRTEKIILEKRKFLKANASFISFLLENELEDSALTEAFGIIGETVEVDRMYYFTANSHEKTKEVYISQKVEWTSKNAVPQIDNPDLQDMSVQRLEEIMGPLTQNEPFTATLSGLTEGDLKEIFVDQDIKSMLLLPIFFQNTLYGFIGFDDCIQERNWREEEIIFLQSLTRNLTNALERRNAESAVKHQQEQVLRSEQKFKALVQEGTDVINILNAQGKAVFTSETAITILGYTPNEIAAANIFEFIHPEDRDRIHSLFHELQQKKQVKTRPYRFLHKDGEWRWMETTGTNLLDDPAVQGIVTNTNDVTALKGQAREIEEINERYRMAARATSDLMYDWDFENDEVIRFHSSLNKLYGYSSEEIAEKDFWRKNIHPDDYRGDLQKLQKALSDPHENFVKKEYRFKRADGTYAIIVDKGYIMRNSEGKAVRMVGASSDISKLTEKKAELKMANKRFKWAMKASNEMIWDWNITTDEVSRNESYKNIYGYDGKGFSAKNGFWRTRIAVGDQYRVIESLETALADPEVEKWYSEYNFSKANGEPAFLADRGFILRDSTGKAVRMVGAVLDITESRRQITEIQRQNKLLKEIAWEQSHVVRAPLARLKGLLNLFDLQDFEEMDRKEILRNIHSSADELDDIVRSIVTRTEQISGKSEGMEARIP